MTERRLIGAAELMGLAEEPFQTYAAEVARLLEALCAAFDPKMCNVLAAHLYVSGAKPAGSERQLTIGDLFRGLGKTPFFAFAIGIIACHNGLNTTGGADGVGRATRNTVVAASMTIFVSNFFLAKLFLWL